MKRAFIAFLAVGAVIFLAAPALADWFPGESSKMHFPQLPDPQGWDVNFETPKVLADDWLCTQSGPVTDIHWWFSSRFDQLLTDPVFRLSIHDNVPAGVDSTMPWSHPGDLLWKGVFTPKVIRYGEGPQGWYDPNNNEWVRPDHTVIWQANVENIREPFVQERGKIYWLDISVLPVTPTVIFRGWKTSLDHFEDDAVVGHLPPEGSTEPIFWRELRDPTGQSLDLAFVITPEPGAVVMLIGAGLIGLAAYARRRRK
jgi:hypothetical protein